MVRTRLPSWGRGVQAPAISLTDDGIADFVIRLISLRLQMGDDRAGTVAAGLAKLVDFDPAAHNIAASTRLRTCNFSKMRVT